MHRSGYALTIYFDLKIQRAENGIVMTSNTLRTTAQRAKSSVAAVAFGSCLAISGVFTSTGSVLAFDQAEKEEIGQIVRDYLLKNPELMIEVQQALEEKQEREANAQKSEVLAQSHDEIFNNSFDPVFGNPEGDVTIVEFFDYNCGFCRRGLADMEYILDNDPNVKFVMKEFPIFGPNSIAVHKVALAYKLTAPEKYYDYHVTMMEQDGQIDEARALKLAEESGIDMDALRDEMNNPAIIDSFRQTDALAGGLGITGTPSYVVGDELVVGALGKDVLIEKIENMRKCGSTSC